MGGGGGGGGVETYLSIHNERNEQSFHFFYWYIIELLSNVGEGEAGVGREKLGENLLGG